MGKGLIIPNNIIDFNTAITTTDYYEQKEISPHTNKSPGIPMSVRGDTSVLQGLDIQSSHTHQDMLENCGCSGSMNISFEYKILVVLILIILMWTFIGWRHHHMVSH